MIQRAAGFVILFVSALAFAAEDFTPNRHKKIKQSFRFYPNNDSKLEMLPAELLSCIIRVGTWGTYTGDLADLAQTCRTFNGLVNDQLNYREAVRYNTDDTSIHNMQNSVCTAIIAGGAHGKNLWQEFLQNVKSKPEDTKTQLAKLLLQRKLGFLSATRRVSQCLADLRSIRGKKFSFAIPYVEGKTVASEPGVRTNNFKQGRFAVFKDDGSHEKSIYISSILPCYYKLFQVKGRDIYLVCQHRQSVFKITNLDSIQKMTIHEIHPLDIRRNRPRTLGLSELYLQSGENFYLLKPHYFMPIARHEIAIE